MIRHLKSSTKTGKMRAYAVVLVVAYFVGQSFAADVPGAMVVCESGRINTEFCPKDVSMEACFNKPKSATFRNNFLMPPEISYGFAKLNMGNNDNTRVNTQVTVTNREVTIMFTCMLQSRCYAASVQYMACGFVNVAEWNQQNGK